MYQIVNDPITGQPAQCKRLADNAFIPMDPANTDYQEYLEWLTEGNELLPADTPPAPTAESVRSQRNALLAETDWMALSDNTLTPEWAAYRQALRDITEQAGFPENVTWPTQPQ
jgi:hypothetical protein